MDKNDMETKDCVFCKIIAGAIPTNVVYENEHTLAFLDIRPSNKGHMLVVPREHYADIFDIPGDVLCALARTGKRIAGALKKAVQTKGINLIMNNGAVAGQIIFHAHLHVLPRFQGDEVFAEPKRVSYDDGEYERIAEKIKNALKK